MALNPSAAADAYLRAFQIARQSQHEKAALALEARQQQTESRMRQQQLQAQQVQTQMAAAARAETIKQNATLAQQRAMQQKAYEDTRLQLQQAQLQDAEQIQSAKVAQAAQQADAKMRFAKLIAAKVPMREAVAQVPELFTPGQMAAIPKEESIESQRKARIISENNRTQQAQERLDDYTAENQARQQQAQAAADARNQAVQAKQNDPSVTIAKVDKALTGNVTPDQQKSLQDLRQQAVDALSNKGLPGKGAPKYPDGTKLKDKDGNPYTVKDGKPEPDEQ